MPDASAADDRARRLGVTAADLREAEPQLSPGVVDAVLEALVRYEEALAELAAS